METVTASSSHNGTSYNDEINAINMQLQEIQSRCGFEKQKYPEGRIPDREVAIHDSEVELTRLIRRPCGDLYCTVCLKSLFMRSIKDETLFPPRCCGERIPLSTIEAKLCDQELMNSEPLQLSHNH
jgi:hypothetical protein